MGSWEGSSGKGCDLSLAVLDQGDQTSSQLNISDGSNNQKSVEGASCCGVVRCPVVRDVTSSTSHKGRGERKV